MAAQALRRGSNTPLRRLAFARPGGLRYLSLSPWSLGRRRSFSSTPGRTTLGAYLERCGANWGDAYDVEPIQEASGRFTWRAEMPPERLAGLRAGDMLESPTFQLQGGCRGRFQLFPLGDSDSLAEGLCSLFLCADAPVLENFQLRLGRVTRDSGASEFCRLEEALQDGFMEVSLELEQRPDVPFEPPEVEQSLFIEELQRAEWQLFQASRLKKTAMVQPPESALSFPSRALRRHVFRTSPGSAPSGALCGDVQMSRANDAATSDPQCRHQLLEDHHCAWKVHHGGGFEVRQLSSGEPGGAGRSGRRWISDGALQIGPGLGHSALLAGDDPEAR